MHVSYALAWQTKVSSIEGDAIAAESICTSRCKRETRTDLRVPPLLANFFPFTDLPWQYSIQPDMISYDVWRIAVHIIVTANGPFLSSLSCEHWKRGPKGCQLKEGNSDRTYEQGGTDQNSFMKHGYTQTNAWVNKFTSLIRLNLITFERGLVSLDEEY